MTLREWLNLPGNTQQILAQKIGVSQGLVSQWLNWLEGKPENITKITAERAVDIETATSGVVTRRHTRPDLFGEPEKHPKAA